MKKSQRTKIAKQLAEARKLIEGGWTQFQFQRDPIPGTTQERYCAAGAIIEACRKSGDDPIPAFQFFADHHFPYCMRSARGVIINWNDQDERTKAEVLDAFDAAIAAALE